MPFDLKEIWKKMRSAKTAYGPALAPGKRPEKLLTEQQAADFLQPFMMQKDALAWLSNDRKANPVISFLLINGKAHYLQDDLLDFIDRLIKPARMHFINGMPAGIERRAGEDRRSGEDRRGDREIQLGSQAERRRMERPDRRLRGELDRRSAARSAAG